MSQGMEDLCTPRPRLLFIPLEEFGCKSVDVLAGVIEVEDSDRALFESVFKDIPQPYSTVHDDVDNLRFPQPHPSRFRMNPSTEFHRIGLGRDGNYMFREQGATLSADMDLIFQAVDDGRLDLMPVNPLLTFRTLLYTPVFAAMPRHPSVHHDDKHIVRPRLFGAIH